MSHQRYQHFQYDQWARSETSNGLVRFWDLSSAQQIVIYGLAILLGGYYILQKSDYFPLLPISELVWNLLVYITPPSLVMALDKVEEKVDTIQVGSLGYADSRSFAAKSAAMRRILRIGGPSTFMGLTRPRAFSGVSSLLKSSSPFSLPGLGNWDNSCYQNSVIQGLASLPAVSTFLRRVDNGAWDSEASTTKALNDIIFQLNDRDNGGQRLWTPAALKSMSSWQQQDAQEYYSKIFDDIEKEAKLGLNSSRKHEGLRMLKARADGRGMQVGAASDTADIEKSESTSEEALLPEDTISNPLEGLLAQRVGCLQCGYVEGLSLVPFNCITLPLDRSFANSVENCLDDFTQLEVIEGVECGRCTLLRQEHNLKELLTREAKAGLETLFKDAQERLALVSQALADDDYSENTISKKCQITNKQRVSSTKTKQAVVARKPESLVLHINRSVFDEMTGVLSKNTSRVNFPEVLDLESWSLGVGGGELERWNMDPSTSLLAGDSIKDGSEATKPPSKYTLRAVITHYGRHENGHYVCYRQDPNDNEQWWRISDDVVSPANVEEVLSQGGAFMLFYTRVREGGTLARQPYTSIEESKIGQLDQLEATKSSPSLRTANGAKDEEEEPCRLQKEAVKPVSIRDRDAKIQPGSAHSTAERALQDTNSSSIGVSTGSVEETPLVEAQSTESSDESASAKNLAGPASAVPAMRTANSRSKKSRRRNRPGMTSMSNMVAAN